MMVYQKPRHKQATGPHFRQQQQQIAAAALKPMRRYDLSHGLDNNNNNNNRTVLSNSHRQQHHRTSRRYHNNVNRILNTWNSHRQQHRLKHRPSHHLRSRCQQIGAHLSLITRPNQTLTATVIREPLKEAPLLHTLTLDLSGNSVGASGARALAALKKA